MTCCLKKEVVFGAQMGASLKSQKLHSKSNATQYFVEICPKDALPSNEQMPDI